MTDPWIVLAALALEAAVGYPEALHRIIPHPVVWIGNMLAALEGRWNRQNFSDRSRKILGVATLVVTVGVVTTVAVAITTGLARLHFGWGVVIVLATMGFAQRSLYDHVAAVLGALRTGDLPDARICLSRIVGRDVQELNEAGIAAGALESLSESFNDGVVAPVFWFAVAGLPGLFAYKAVNTADSMIGHKEPRWKDFGWASARTDDVLNFLPARMAGGLIALAGWGGWRTMLADAPKHASPNAGWPEAAMAGALNVSLGGPVNYDGVRHDRPSFGTGAAPALDDLRRGLQIYLTACGLLWAIFAMGGFLWRQ